MNSLGGDDALAAECEHRRSRQGIAALEQFADLLRKGSIIRSGNEAIDRSAVFGLFGMGS